MILIKEIDYTYSKDGKNAWNNLLTSVDLDGDKTVDTNAIISYDEIGNPLTYLGNELDWNGRQLKSFSGNGNTITYKYDADGYRATKTVNGNETTYRYVNGQLVYEEKPDGRQLFYLYDSYGYLTAIRYYNGDTSTLVGYYVTTNAQGDVIGIYNAAGDLRATYEYDAWGNIIAIKDVSGNTVTSSTHIAMLNSVRYRSYCYDNETGLYYVISRYYNPQVGRFLNADGLVDNRGLNTQNMFQYCGNNPVMYADPSGQLFGLIVLGVLGVGLIIGLSSCSSTPALAPSTSASLPETIPSQPAQETLTTDQKVLIATIAAEATVTAQGKPVSSAGRQAMANVAINRVGSREWSKYTTVAEICQFTGFDGYGNKNYQACMTYLNSRDGSNATYEAIIWDVMAAYDNDITGGAQLYYTPAAMKPAGSSPNWNFSVLTEVNIPGVDPYYEGRFYKYR